ncbi:uncharacterized protein LOC105420219 [Amborella trichopoda]|uniref:uncharacterized protein LOC105420219 n=1 Tax=Amborella trichopoda TaxID=13333 RepID=UPI0005D3D795|nr:uncharacterized protein LOC105420219 [Amborella trichopoda]|eukprot:XP_011621278.1 uncharacterized protein LOC105420219 [Amborella trichopoda]
MSRMRANNSRFSNENTKALGEFVKTLGAMTQMMKEAMPAPSTPAPDSNDSSLIQKFRRLAPLTFLELGGVEKAERWRRQVETIFKVLNCIVEHKVRLGTFILEGDVEHWWGLVEQSWERSGTEMTWENFLEAFNKKYFPDSVRERKEVEFIKLQQGNLTVEQYAAKFVELSSGFGHEDRKGRGRVPGGGNWKMRPAQFGNSRRKARPPLKRNFRRRENQRDKMIQWTLLGDVGENRCPTCPLCRKDNHVAADYRRKTKACFECGKPDHQIRDCLVRGPENRPKTQGRVFVLTEQEAKASTSVIRGTNPS